MCIVNWNGENMKVKIRKNSDNVFFMELSGSLDLYSSNQLKELVVKTFENSIECLIISLKDVASINSTGVGALIFASSTLRKLNCPLIIVAPEGPVLSVLELTNIKTYFTVVPSLKEALAEAAN